MESRPQRPDPGQSFTETDVMSERTTDHLDVLVVGAGPIGLTRACHLRRLGLSVHLIEKPFVFF